MLPSVVLSLFLILPLEVTRVKNFYTIVTFVTIVAMNTSLLHRCAVFKILSITLLLIHSFTMTQRFYPVSARNWFTLNSVQLQSGGRTASFIGSRNIYAPAEYSYHCQLVSSFQDALLVSNNTNQNTSEWRLNFIDFQVQLQRCIYILQQWIKCFFFKIIHWVFHAFCFTIQIQGFGLANATDFSYANDCAGFFTAGIWMGLLTSLLLLLIFVYGLHMIMHLNTMDRFDDPKGPSISVPQSEWSTPSTPQSFSASS